MTPHIEYKCHAPFCTNTYIRPKPKQFVPKTFFNFPFKDEARCKIWAEFCGAFDAWRNNPHSFKYHYLCSDHFELKYFTGKLKVRLWESAIPTIKQQEPFDQAPLKTPHSLQFSCPDTFVSAEKALMNTSDILSCLSITPVSVSVSKCSSSIYSSHEPTSISSSVPPLLNLSSPIDTGDANPMKVIQTNSLVSKPVHFSPTMLTCTAPFCTSKQYNRKVKDHATTSFFQFPIRDFERCRIWAEFCGMSNLWKDDNIEMFESYYLCSGHFEPKYFSNSYHPRLLESAVPTIMNPESENEMSVTLSGPSAPLSTTLTCTGNTSLLLSTISSTSIPKYEIMPLNSSTTSGLDISLLALTESSVSFPTVSTTDSVIYKSTPETWLKQCASIKSNLINNEASNKVIKRGRIPVAKFSCKAPFCTNKYIQWMKKHSGNKSFFKFPVKNPETCQRWVEFCDLTDKWKKKPNLFKYYYLCSDHFELKCFSGALKKPRLLTSAVPTQKHCQGSHDVVLLSSPLRLNYPILCPSSADNHSFPESVSSISPNSSAVIPLQSKLPLTLASPECSFPVPNSLSSKPVGVLKKLSDNPKIISSNLFTKRNKFPMLELRCKAPFCMNKCSYMRTKHFPKKTFFQFPVANIAVCMAWADFCNMSDAWELNKDKFKSYLLCSDHFELKYFSNKSKKSGLLQSALPTIKRPDVAAEVIVMSSPLIPSSPLSLLDDSPSTLSQMITVEPNSSDLSHFIDFKNGSLPPVSSLPLVLLNSTSSNFSPLFSTSASENTLVTTSVNAVIRGNNISQFSALFSKLDMSPKVEYTCKAPLCEGKYISPKDTNLPCKSFFKFPSNDPLRCAVWAKFCELDEDDTMDDAKMNMYKNYFLCSDHFELKYFTSALRNRLLCFAVPTLKHANISDLSILPCSTSTFDSLVLPPLTTYSSLPNYLPKTTSLLMSTAPISTPLLMTSSINTPIVSSHLPLSTLSSSLLPSTSSLTDFITNPLPSTYSSWDSSLQFSNTLESDFNAMMVDLYNFCDPTLPQNNDPPFHGTSSESSLIPASSPSMLAESEPMLAESGQLFEGSPIPTSFFTISDPVSSPLSSDDLPSSSSHQVSVDPTTSDSLLASPASLCAFIKPVLYSYSDHNYARNSDINF